MEEVNDSIVTKWNEIKAQVELLEADVVKHSRGVNAAGNRVRKGLRTLKAACADLVKASIASSKLAKLKKE